MKNAFLVGAALAAISGASTVLAHGGGLNAEGCHNDRKNGGYHCHRTPVVAPTTSVTPVAPSATTQPAAPVRSVVGPTCYVGPRGGTYTITASGRKNYGGC